MLQHIHIENYTLIESLDIEFRAGLNLLTGETGSGKSIVVEAMGLLLGDRASPDMIRRGAERARISGVFAAGDRYVAKSLEEAGIELELGEDIIVQRDILPGSKSRVFVNNQPVTVNLLKTIAPHLAEVHGQNEQQQLYLAAEQMQMLDRFGGLKAQMGRVQAQFEKWKKLSDQQAELIQKRQEWLRQSDLWRYQWREIDGAGITAGEDQKLKEEKLLLANAARIQERLAASYDLLYDSAHSAAAALKGAEKNLEEVAQYDAAMATLAKEIESSRAAVEDVAMAVRDRLSRLEASPDRLEVVEDRLALLDKMKRKYGPSLDDVVRQGEQVKEQLRQAEDSEAHSHDLEALVKESAAEYETEARELSKQRRKSAKEFKKTVEEELQALEMKGTAFEAMVETATDANEWTGKGMDAVEFLISPNPGEPLRQLAKIASGGETSRLMLAMETVSDARRGEGQSQRTLIFDEVDAGIGGKAAEMVGQKLRNLARQRQVLCVTHLPQIASFAQHHFLVEKKERNGRTRTSVEYLDREDRLQEVARMLSGSRVTEAGLKHAAQLLKANG